MPRFQITRPDGKSFEVTAPEGATQDQVLAYAMKQGAPQAAGSPQETTSPPPQGGGDRVSGKTLSELITGQPALDVVGRAKAALTDPSEAGRLWPGGPRIGPQVLKPVGNVLRGVGGYLMPGSVPEAAAQLPGYLIPGGGALPALARTGATGLARGVAGGLMGKDPYEEGAKGLIQGAGGEVIGAAGKAVARELQSAFSKDLTKLAKVAEQAIPGVGGKTPQETLAKMLSGEGRDVLQKNYRTTLEGLFKQHGDPVVVVPGLERVGSKNAIAPASKALEEIQLLTGKARKAGDMQKLLALDQARGELLSGLKSTWGAKGTSALEKLAGDYRKGSELLRTFGGGKEAMTEARLKKVVDPKGNISWPELQASFLKGKDKIQKGMGPIAKDLQAALLRGETNPLKRDVKGGFPSAYVSALPIPHVGVHGLPHAPIRVGAPEANAQALSDLLRRATVPATGTLLE